MPAIARARSGPPARSSLIMRSVPILPEPMTAAPTAAGELIARSR